MYQEEHGRKYEQHWLRQAGMRQKLQTVRLMYLNLQMHLHLSQHQRQ